MIEVSGIALVRAMDCLMENAKDGALLLLVPEGEFLAGGPGRDEGGGPFPVDLPAFYLALHPVTNGQYLRFVKEAGQREPSHWNGRIFPRGQGDHPVVDVSWDDAVAYCQWSGLRLPMELEWEKGSRGLYGRVYPWGSEWEEDRCRYLGNRRGEETCGVWGYSKGVSVWGQYLMSGNVWEWCSDWYDSGSYIRYKGGDLRPPENGEYRVVRGGSWHGDPYDARCSSRYYYYPPGSRFSDRGFRCARAF